MDKPKIQEGCWIRSTTIGRGSNGTVSLAVRKSGGGVFAVKSVDTTSCLPHQIEALENEIRIHRILSSPYVVEYLGDGVTAEPQMVRNLYLEYLPGGSVADMARSTRHGGGSDVDERMIRNFSFSIVSALNYLHAKGIVHCDVKGDNVLVGPYSGAAKLADLGSAIIIGQARNKILPRGSPLWMAPEVIRGEYQGPESDVWSLGCTVIEMITGKPAWEDKGVVETLQRIGYSDELPRLPTQLSELGRDFVRKCLRRDIDQRWCCDQLLKHPFLSMPSSTSKLPIHLSPRSNLDFSNMDDIDEEDEEESVREEFSLQKVGDGEEICYSELTERVKGLVSGPPPPLWESDGWIVVRNSDKESEQVSISGAGNCSQLEWAKWEYMESVGGVEAEIRRPSAEYAESTGEECLHSQEEKENNNDPANDVVSSCSNLHMQRNDDGLPS